MGHIYSLIWNIWSCIYIKTAASNHILSKGIHNTLDWAPIYIRNTRFERIYFIWYHIKTFSLASITTLTRCAVFSVIKAHTISCHGQNDYAKQLNGWKHLLLEPLIKWSGSGYNYGRLTIWLINGNCSGKICLQIGCDQWVICISDIWRCG